MRQQRHMFAMTGAGLYQVFCIFTNKKAGKVVILQREITRTAHGRGDVMDFTKCQSV